MNGPKKNSKTYNHNSDIPIFYYLREGARRGSLGKMGEEGEEGGDGGEASKAD